MSTVPRRSHLSDWELWACAAQQIDEHGEAAAEMAAMKADDLLAAGDLAGSHTWLDILARILHLQLPRTDETSH
jgi:hypothetical protein